MRGHGKYMFASLHPDSIQSLGKSMDGRAETWMCIQASALHFKLRNILENPPLEAPLLDEAPLREI